MIYFHNLCKTLKEIEEEGSTTLKLGLLRDFIKINKASMDTILLIKRLLSLKNSKIYTGLSDKRTQFIGQTTNIQDKREYSLTQILEFIAEISKIEGKNSIRDKYDFFNDKCLYMSSNTVEFFKRIITNRLRIGLSEKALQKILIENKITDLENTTNLKFNLAKAIKKDSSLTGFLRSTPHYLEKKYDGIRLMVFFSILNKRVFTRKGQEITHKLKDFTNLKYSGQPLILDCELELNSFSSFSLVLRSKKEMLPNYKFQVFDVLSVGGESKIELPLYKRKEVLKQLFKNFLDKEEYPFQLVESKLVEKYTDVFSYFNKEIEKLDSKIQGFMVKPYNSIYQPGKRSWYKVKRQEETIDLLVLKRNKGNGKLSEIYCSFDLAIKKEEDYQYICRVGSGFTEQDLLFINNQLKWSEEKPLQKIIFEIEYQEILSSKKDMGYSLRFPIFKRYREDLKEPSVLSDILSS